MVKLKVRPDPLRCYLTRKASASGGLELIRFAAPSKNTHRRCGRSCAPKAEESFYKATENAARARTASRPECRTFYLEMEQKWLRLAHAFEWLAQLSRRDHEVEGRFH
jgi:hypothetical protein